MKPALAFLLFITATLCGGAEVIVPDNVVFERDVEYSNPDNQHLQMKGK